MTELAELISLELSSPLYRLNCCSQGSTAQKYFRYSLGGKFCSTLGIVGPTIFLEELWCCAKWSTSASPKICLPVEECKRSIAVEWPDLCSIMSLCKIGSNENRGPVKTG
ncbi:hypothetical protein EUGRSUZ_F01660 [Eucalyptus grandis]|uniref:Uncharacterized protein n=2 Tax=Eucalyptus grandis TaxID=71139 RepID=A0ACC3KFV4_EUCGR|nr:hypothetical protein EUGRSUZ_F01660 [Eucalyptus grandis]